MPREAKIIAKILDKRLAMPDYEISPAMNNLFNEIAYHTLEKSKISQHMPKVSDECYAELPWRTEKFRDLDESAQNETVDLLQDIFTQMVRPDVAEQEDFLISLGEEKPGYKIARKAD